MLFPRWFWWTLYALALLSTAWTLWAFFYDRERWHLDSIVLDVFSLTLATHRLVFPPEEEPSS